MKSWFSDFENTIGPTEKKGGGWGRLKLIKPKIRKRDVTADTTEI